MGSNEQEQFKEEKKHTERIVEHNEKSSTSATNIHITNIAKHL